MSSFVPSGRMSLVGLSLVLAACTRAPAAPTKPAVDSATYAADTKAWRVKRLDAIAGPDGWSTLAGLFWLDSARYTIGSSGTSTITLPSDNTPASLGTLTIDGRTVHFAATRGATVMHDSTAVDTITMATDKRGKGTVLRAGSVTYRVIERGGRLALRVKDSAYVLRREFKGLEDYPLDTAFRVLAHLVPHATPRTLRIMNVLGQVDEYRSPGMLEFAIHGVSYHITASFEGSDTTQYFVIFRDATSRDSTYPAGRFMYATLVDSAGNTLIDFNRSYNPPCAFTAFATCPLPPKENVLSVPVTAGELRYKGPHGSTLEEIARKAIQ
jgi:uncharacterized protein (DUF1684 family)